MRIEPAENLRDVEELLGLLDAQALNDPLRREAQLLAHAADLGVDAGHRELGAAPLELGEGVRLEARDEGGGVGREALGEADLVDVGDLVREPEVAGRLLKDRGVGLAADAKDCNGRGPVEVDGGRLRVGDDAAAELGELAGEGVHEGGGVAPDDGDLAREGRAKQETRLHFLDDDVLRDEGRIALEAVAGSALGGEDGLRAGVHQQGSLRARHLQQTAEKPKVGH